MGRRGGGASEEVPFNPTSMTRLLVHATAEISADWLPKPHIHGPFLTLEAAHTIFCSVLISYTYVIYNHSKE